jgi:hypothetical protein
MSEQDQIRTEIGDVVAAAIVTFSRTMRGANWIKEVNRVSDTRIQVITSGDEMLSVVVGKAQQQ